VRGIVRRLQCGIEGGELVVPEDIVVRVKIGRAVALGPRNTDIAPDMVMDPAFL
jgi:hypothetical protein